MRPTRASLVAVGAWMLVGIGASLWPQLMPVFRGVGAMLLVLATADAMSLYRRRLPTLERDTPSTMALGERYNVELRIETGRRERIVVHDHAPHGGHVEGMPCVVDTLRDRPTTITYRFRPLTRGPLTFDPASIRIRGPIGLLEQHLRVGEATETRVYPNFLRYSRISTPGEESIYQGVHLARRRGEGMEFHQLREYREGDSPRQIDWKSVARRQQLISREYRSEQNQNVVFLVDCGRRMRAHDGELTLLDQALNALLLLSYVALRQGDSVGVLTFGGTQRWLPPVRGAASIRHVLNTVHDLDSTPEPSDFEQAVTRLSAHQRRRALIVVLTNLGDDDTGSLLDSLLPLRSKHIVLVASLRDPELANQLEVDVESVADGLRMLSTLTYLEARHAARARLSSAGIATLESEPAALPPKLVERYMQIKRAGHL